MQKEVAAEPVYQGSGAQWGRSIFIAILPVFACFLGGGAAKWSEGVIVALLGLFLVVQPPRRSLGWPINLAFVALILCAFASYLPHGWFGTPAWRATLVHDLQILLPNSLTPQPWLTAGYLASLAAALCWLYRVSAQELELRVARFELRLFAACITFLAGLSILLHLTRSSLPFWQNAQGFGPFPDGNLTADLFAASSLLILASAQDDIRYGRKRWLFWVAAFLIVLAAVFLNGSGTALIVLLAANAIWIGVVAMRTGARTALALALFLLLLCTFLIAGGQTLDRWHLRWMAGPDPLMGFHWPIAKEFFPLMSSLPGIGLGNFESIFGMIRSSFWHNNRPADPGSDWLWGWIELGFPAVIAIIIGIVLLVRRVWPLQVGTNQRFRLAALIGGLTCALDGIIDIPAHRVGTAYSGLFLLGLALHRPTRLRISSTVPWVFRVLGVALLAIGISWVSAWRTLAMQPGAIGVRNVKQLAAVASRGRNFPEAIDLSSRALQWAPLDWELYQLRAIAEVEQQLPYQVALEDFRRARFLEPFLYSLPLQEGFVWFRSRPDLSAAAWTEALRRARGDRREVFGKIISSVSLKDRDAHAVVEKMAFNEPSFALDYLAQLPATEFHASLHRFLERDPNLTLLAPEQKRELFHLWRERGGLSSLVEAVGQHPDWLPLAWRAVASSRAATGDFQGGCALMQQFLRDVHLPAPEPGMSIEQLKERVYDGRGNFAAGFTLFRAQLDGGQPEEALATVRHFVTNPEAPPYFHALEAQAWAAEQDWHRSWDAWVAFDKAQANHR